MSHLRSTNRTDVFVRWVQQLAEMLGESGSHTEAGLALQLHADMLEWSDTLVPAVADFPEETQSARKEKLYLRMADLFRCAREGCPCALFCDFLFLAAPESSGREL